MTAAHTASRAEIDLVLDRRRVIVTCGTGGVGKTTLSAALALRAAALGRKTLVITIDPAKRLATSLGDELDHQPRDLTAKFAEIARAAGVQIAPGGSVWALMPDTRHTFEQFVHELAPDELTAQRVMSNPIFQVFAQEFSGTNEYMALERLYALEREGKYDCIILDTPPSRNTLEFLDAPDLLARLFEERLIRWLVLPTNRLLNAGMRKAFVVLEKLTGAGFMTNLFDFASALFEVRAAFSANLAKIVALLRSQAVGFVLVAAPAPDTAAEALVFVESVRSHGFHFDGVALNRTLGYLGPSQGAGPGIDVLKALCAREERAAQALAKADATLLARLPELARDVHSMEDLFHVATQFGPFDHGNR